MKNQIAGSFTGLNFSGDESSWFDLWHTHADCEDEDNHSWDKRAAYWQELIELYHYFQKQLENYPKPFQMWIEIWENDPSEDAVYIHTPNPNSNNFPITVEAGVEPEISNTNLKTWVEKLPFDKLRRKMLDDNVIYLFDKRAGISLKP